MGYLRAFENRIEHVMVDPGNSNLRGDQKKMTQITAQAEPRLSVNHHQGEGEHISLQGDQNANQTGQGD